MRSLAFAAGRRPANLTMLQIEFKDSKSMFVHELPWSLFMRLVPQVVAGIVCITWIRLLLLIHWIRHPFSVQLLAFNQHVSLFLM